METLKEQLGDHPGLVFASRKRGTEGGHMKDAGHTWARVLEKAGVSGVTIHDFRRSFGSVLVNSGVPITVVAKAMGHSDARTTMKH